VLSNARFMESNRNRGGAQSDSIVIGSGRGVVTPRYVPGTVKLYAHGYRADSNAC